MVNRIQGRHYKTLEPIRLEISDGMISKLEKIEDSISNRLIAPGLVDLQINGFQGVDFNEQETIKDDVKQATESLWKSGVTTYFPTLITNSKANISQSIRTIVQACTSDLLINNTIQGIHLEGPFLSKETGPRGAHPIEYIQAPDWELFCNWQEQAEGKIKLLTMSPEWPGSVEFIWKCADSGVKVAIGHTAATPMQIKNAVEAGATLSTHLGNAAHLMLPRHTNYIWEQLANDNLWTSIIADGFHLPEAVLKVVFKVKPKTSFLVSDSTKFAGLAPGSYQSPIGGEVELDQNGRLYLKNEPGLLAGSAKSLLNCVEYLVSSQVLTLSDSLDRASFKPMQYLNIHSINGLQVGAPADLMVFEQKGSKLEVFQTVKSGQTVYSV